MYRIALNMAISFISAGDGAGSTARGRRASELLNVAAPPPETDEPLETLWGFIDELDEFNRSLMILYLDDEPYEAIAADPRHLDHQRRHQN